MTKPQPRVLVVGAGAIGTVFAHHLQRGGARVAVLDRSERVAELAAGVTLIPLHRFAPRRRPVRVLLPEVYADPAELSGTWDQVYLCLPSPALRSGVLVGVGPHVGSATVVLLTAGLGDRELLAEHVPERQLVQGMISLVSYAAPLPSERVRRPGLAYWFPPGARTGFAGPADRAGAVVAALSAGGLPARVLPGARTSGASAALLMPHLVALEREGWSLSRLRRSPLLALASRAADEARIIVAAVEGRPGPRSVRPWLTRLLLPLAPHLLPFPLEAYLEVHFTKVGAQTTAFMEAFVERGRALGLEVGALRALLGGLSRA